MPVRVGSSEGLGVMAVALRYADWELRSAEQRIRRSQTGASLSRDGSMNLGEELALQLFRER